MSSFNTQPPEGGWFCGFTFFTEHLGFNTQPPEGGWLILSSKEDGKAVVSTLSRLKAAGSIDFGLIFCNTFQHSAA